MAVKTRSARLRPTDVNELVSADHSEGVLVIQRRDGSQLKFGPIPDPDDEGGGGEGSSRSKIFTENVAGTAGPDVFTESLTEGMPLFPGELVFEDTTSKYIEFELMTSGWTFSVTDGPADIRVLFSASTEMDEEAVAQFYAWMIESNPSLEVSFPTLDALKTGIGWPSPWATALGNVRIANLLEGERQQGSVVLRPAVVQIPGITTVTAQLILNDPDPASIVSIDAVNVSILDVFGSATI